MDSKLNETASKADKAGMKRFLIFPILIPTLAFAVYLVAETTVSGLPTTGFTFLTLAYLYPLGLIPASLIASVDWSLSGRSVYLRMAGTVIFATILAELIARLGLGVPSSPRAWLMGAIPAAVCSWLAGMKPA